MTTLPSVPSPQGRGSDSAAPDRAPALRHNAIRVGLSHVKGLTTRSIGSIIAGRGGAPYETVEDFLRRSGVRPAEAVALADGGALDGFGLPRPEVAWRLALERENEPPGAPLHGNGRQLPRMADITLREKLRDEREALGMCVSAHPLKMFETLQRNGVIKARDLPAHVGKTVTLTGWLVTAKRTRTVHGQFMKFLTLEDETDIYEATLFPKTYRKYGHLLDGRGPYRVTGMVENDGGDITLTTTTLARVLA